MSSAPARRRVLRQPPTERWLLGLSILLMVVGSLALTRPASAQTEAVIYSFGQRNGDGVEPEGTLIADARGNFYGTTTYGGTVGNGTIFKLVPNGHGGWKETVLYRFPGGVAGSQPNAATLLMDRSSNLYGTTFFGGVNNVGVAFELSPVAGHWEETVLYSFGSYAGDGVKPINALIMDANGNLFGVTAFGGSAGTGSVFELSPGGNGWTERVIYSDAASAAALTMDGVGNLFGTTENGVFELSPDGSAGWIPKTLHSFGATPVYPQGTLVFDQAGNLYGTTYQGGAKKFGSVYRLSPAPHGDWIFRTLYSFQGYPVDGQNPFAGLLLDGAGNLYGTTFDGGKYNGGTVFELVAVGGGTYRKKTLWNFNGSDGEQILGGLIQDGLGNLYGTSVFGGAVQAGAIFEVIP